MIRILVVDDHPIVREGLVAILSDQPDFQVVGAAGSAAEAIGLAERLDPEVVLLDLELPGMDGAEALPHLLRAAPEARCLVFTAYGTDERVVGALRAGARGYLLKGATVGEIAAAIRVVYAGGSHLAPGVASRALAEFRVPQASPSALTAREREVLQRVAEGLSNKQIARVLGITERTVKFHMTSLFNKLGAENRAQVTALAIRQRLVEQ